MEEIIKKIIEIEREAQNLVTQALAQNEKIHANAQDELKSMEANIMEMSEHKIEQLKAGNRKEADDKLARIREHTAERLQQMDKLAAENQEVWEDQIFNRVIGR
jgi:vacuolar-type H+-ATPase subunit H